MPDWTPDQGGPEGWAKEVACIAYEGDGALVLVDPLVNGDDWAEIDALVERHSAPVALVVTCPWHARSAREAQLRYVNSAGVETYAHENAIRDRERIDFGVSRPVPDAAELPGGIDSLATDVANGEITLYLGRIRTVVVADVLIGAQGERSEALRVCPESWVEPENTAENVRTALLPLLEREIDAIVPLHGAPVLNGAREALEAALR